MADDYSIEARSLKIPYLPASHDFWVLRDPSGNAIAELHGLATNRKTGEPAPIGTDDKEYSLRAWHYVHDSEYAANIGVQRTDDSYISKNQKHQTVFSGSKEEVFGRWSAATNNIDRLNNLDLDYPAYGVNISSPTVNSNSAYRTFGEIMDVPIANFPYRMEPGLDNRMIPKEEIEKIRYNQNQPSTQDENLEILIKSLTINSSRREVIDYAFAALMSDNFETLSISMNNVYSTHIGQETLQQANQAAIDYDAQNARIQQPSAPVMKMV